MLQYCTDESHSTEVGPLLCFGLADKLSSMAVSSLSSSEMKQHRDSMYIRALRSLSTQIQGVGMTCAVISAAVSCWVPETHVDVHKLGAESSSGRFMFSAE